MTVPTAGNVKNIKFGVCWGKCGLCQFVQLMAQPCCEARKAAMLVSKALLPVGHVFEQGL